MRSSFAVVVALLLSAAVSVGCAEKMRRKQLEKVAKDWCEVVRASQVIAVYPLTEDLQPGDVLLVRTPIQRQHEQYKARGFLPLDQHLVRLPMSGYDRFYRGGYLVERDSLLPRVWQFPNPKPKEGDTLYSAAPRAAFPTYKFTVTSGAGINVALPVQGIPIGLSLLGASSGDGSVVISDAITYGLPDFDMRTIVQSWATTNKEYLKTFGSDTEEVYLRVVSRVYLTGGVNIVVNSDASAGGSATAGASKPVDLFASKQGEPAENYGKIIDAMNKAVDASAPGGTIKVAAASSRSVSLTEKFPRPLVIGYLGFDMRINADGSLGGPTPTLSNLQGTSVSPAKAFPQEYVVDVSLMDEFQPLLTRKLELQRNPQGNAAAIAAFDKAARNQGFEDFGDAANAVTTKQITSAQIKQMKAELAAQLSNP